MELSEGKDKAGIFLSHSLAYQGKTQNYYKYLVIRKDGRKVLPGSLYKTQIKPALKVL